MGIEAGKIVLHGRNTAIHFAKIQVFIFTVAISSVEAMNPDPND